MKYIKTVQLKTEEELLQLENVQKVETGIIRGLDNKWITDWINPEEMFVLGRVVDVYQDPHDHTFDLVIEGVGHSDDSSFVIYGLTDYTWLVKKEVGEEE